MKILFDSDVIIAERCNGCDGYHEHFLGKAEGNLGAFKCKNCGRITVTMSGDLERIITPGSPPAGV